MTNSAQHASEKRKPASDGLIPDEIVQFAALLGYDLRAPEGLQALREDVEYVRRWRSLSKTAFRFLIWAGGALIGGLLTGLGGALYAAAHFPGAFPH